MEFIESADAGPLTQEKTQEETAENKKQNASAEQLSSDKFQSDLKTSCTSETDRSENELVTTEKHQESTNGNILLQAITAQSVNVDDAAEVNLELAIPDYIPRTSEVAIEKLVYGMLSNVLPELQKAKDTLGEVTENQRILIETVVQENAKFQDSKVLKEVTEIMQQAKMYHTKLVTVKRDMVMLHEKSAKLKKRALKLQQQKQKEALQREQDREKELERERQLIAKTARSPPVLT